ncbi:hypothetical protein F0U60_20375 [Archangium minus]|uniref:Uncharacterized protein n=1 Tax=Archangium minus TaxID=83450 RepID=A0ABY9WTX6_9BACT|nr:hypothetical protein F0U60_20375 [Archangium minus]
MEKTVAVVQAPLTFLDKNGAQVSIPPSVFWFEGAELKVDETKPPVSENSWLADWLKYLAKTGVIVAAPPDAQPTRPAMVLQAKNPGSAGNNIEIDITYAEPPTTFTLKVTQTDVYADLTLETLPVVLGTDQKAGTRPGLVRVQGTPTALPKEQTGQLEGADATQRGTWTAAADSGTAFTLEAREPGKEVIKVQISPPKEQTFTLTATWTKSVSGLDASKLETELKQFGYVLTAAKPADGYTLPRGGKFQLKGGVDSTFASLVPAAKPL